MDLCWFYGYVGLWFDLCLWVWFDLIFVDLCLWVWQIGVVPWSAMAIVVLAYLWVFANRWWVVLVDQCHGRGGATKVIGKFWVWAVVVLLMMVVVGDAAMVLLMIVVASCV